MGFFAGGAPAGGSGNPNTPQTKSSTLSPLAIPFTINPNHNRADQGLSNLNGVLGENQGFLRDPPIFMASSSTEYRFPCLPQVAVSEGCRAYRSDSNLWQGNHVNSSMKKLHYGSGSQCIDWYKAEIPEFVTDDYFSGPCNFSEGSVGVPSSVLKDVRLKGIPITELSDAISMKEPCNAFVADTIYKFSKEGAYSGSESVVRAPTSLHKEMTYSHVFDPVSLESSDTFDSKYSYDSYLQQLDHCTTDLAYYYPAMTCSTSFQFTAPSACGTNSLMTLSMLEDKTSLSGDLYGTNADYAINVPVRIKETRMDQNLEAKVDYDESSKMLDRWKCPCISSFSVGHEAAEKKSITIPVEVHSRVETVHLDLSNTFSGSSLTVPVDESTKDSLGTLDQTVDSPCWKGASVSQQSPFGSLEPGFVPSMEVESKGQTDMDKCQRQLSVTAGCSESLTASEKIRKEVICNEEMENPLVYNSKESSVVSILPNTQPLIRGDIYKIFQTSVKEIQHSAICEGQNIEVSSDKEKVRDEKDNEATSLNQEIVTSSRQPIQASSVANYKASCVCVLRGSSSKCQQPNGLAVLDNIVEQLGSSLLKNAPLSVVLGALRYISEMLLSSNNFDVGESKENDHELLQLVINNLRAFSIENKQDSSNESLEVAHPNISHDTKRNKHSVSSGLKNNDPDNMAFDHGASRVDKDQDVSRAFQKIVGKNHCEEEQNLQAQVYKKLWVDAEAALCSMKYELQVAQMKSQSDNLTNQTEGNFQPFITRLKAHPMEQGDEFGSRVKEGSSVFGSATT